MIDHGAVEWTKGYLERRKVDARSRINSANSGISGWRGLTRDVLRAIQISSSFDDYAELVEATIGLEEGNFVKAIKILKEDALRLSLQTERQKRSSQNQLDIPPKTQARLMGNVIRRL